MLESLELPELRSEIPTYCLFLSDSDTKFTGAGVAPPPPNPWSLLRRPPVIKLGSTFFAPKVDAIQFNPPFPPTVLHPCEEPPVRRLFPGLLFSGCSSKVGPRGGSIKCFPSDQVVRPQPLVTYTYTIQRFREDPLPFCFPIRSERRQWPPEFFTVSPAAPRIPPAFATIA